MNLARLISMLGSLSAACITLGMVLFLSACGEKQESVTIKGKGGETITITRTAPDPARVAELKADLGKLKQLIEVCDRIDTPECASARQARSDLMFAKPNPTTPQQYKYFAGGSRDIQKP